MGLLVDGVWRDQWYDTKEDQGKFVRKQPQFRNWVTADGAPGPTGTGGFKAEFGRYHLYISYACPWAHRALIFRMLKGLDDAVSLSVVDWLMGENGWAFSGGAGVMADPINDADFMHQVYTAADSNYSGRATVPVLWDKQTKTIVSNESSEIIRMFNDAFDDVGAKPGNYYPEPLRAEIDALNGVIYDTLNNGVYKAGFATTQKAYDAAVLPLFATLDYLEGRLGRCRYLVGPTITETDWRAFTTLVRFDAVYVGHFKCNLKRVADYTVLSGYLRDLYQQPGIADTVKMDHIKNHYYQSHTTINPTGIVPLGPELDFSAPHDRHLLDQ